MNSPLARLLRNDLLLLPHSDESNKKSGLSVNAYAVLGADHAVLVDAAFADVLPDVRALGASGFAPVALVLTHRNDAVPLPELLRDFKIPVFLHPQNAALPPEKRWHRFQFADPDDSALLLSCGLQSLLFAGPKQGHIMLYQERGQLLFAGDCAVGPSLEQTEANNWTTRRPPDASGTNDNALREMWRALTCP